MNRSHRVGRRAEADPEKLSPPPRLQSRPSACGSVGSVTRSMPKRSAHLRRMAKRSGSLGALLMKPWVRERYRARSRSESLAERTS
eukprot:scaffold16668_cov119-Isochrysis_galbana.AAC.2